MRTRALLAGLVTVGVVASFGACGPYSLAGPQLRTLPAPTSDAYFAAWTNGPSTDPGFFPIGVWLQRPTMRRRGQSNAENYRDLGFNIIVNTPNPVTRADLAALPDGMYLMAGEVTDLTRADDRVIGYVAYDEPDLAGGGVNCVPADELNGIVTAMRAADPTRPVWVNFGPGMALPDFAQRAEGCPRPWPGISRWKEHGETDDFMPSYSYQPYYEWGAVPDIVSVDHYATADHSQPEANQQLWGYGRMTRRAVVFAGAGKPVWAYVQTGNVNGQDEPARPPTPEQVRVMVWMALINGASGIEYFVHTFDPWLEDALLIDPVMSGMVQRINAEVTALAPVLNSPTRPEMVGVGGTASPVRILVKSYDDATYTFAIENHGSSTSATFTVPAQPDGEVTVIGEDRRLTIVDGAFTDDFAPYGIHLYRIDPEPAR